MEDKIITWGLTAFFKRTPVWAKKAILTVFGLFAVLITWATANPNLIPPNIEHYILISVPVLMMFFKAFGVDPKTGDTTQNP